MYTPYGNAANMQQQQQQQQFQQQNLQHPQPQHPSFQQPQQHAQYGNMGQQPQTQQSGPYANFFQDPATSMAAQLAKNSIGSSNQYLQQNFGSIISGTGDLNYYFRVSNSYVFRKILLILFPYRNKNWTRFTAENPGTSGNTANVAFAPPSQDINAPDLYIPLMSFITYILLWAVFQGLKGDFHPQLFGYLASQTLACSFLDILIFKVGLYLLNCSTQSSLWDLISFSGYKYVTIITLLCWKHLIGGSWMVYYGVVVVFTTSLALFLMRSLKFLVLPSANTAAGSSASNSISSKQRKIRIQFLFVYAVVFQFLIVLFMSR